MFVLIAGVNVHNEYYVNRIAGIAGYAGRAVELIDETTRKIDLLSDQERKKADRRGFLCSSVLSAVFIRAIMPAII